MLPCLAPTCPPRVPRLPKFPTLTKSLTPTPQPTDAACTLHPTHCTSFIMGRQTTASIHDQYNKVAVTLPDGTKTFRRHCKHCAQSYAKGTSNSGLSDHYNTHHARTADRDAELPPPKRRAVQSQLVSRVVSIEHVYQTIARTFARHSLPHHLLEQPDVQEAFTLFRDSHCMLPNCRQLVEAQGRLAGNMRMRVVERLRQHAQTAPVSVAMDGWTNVRHHKVNNIVVLCSSQAYYWCSIVNTQNNNTAEWLKEPLLAVMNSVRQLGIPIVALVADNEAVNKAVYRQLTPTFPFLIQVPCGAHVIQLCVGRTLALPAMKDVLETMGEIINGFSANKDHRNRLIASQKAAAVDSPLSILKPCTTRWSSHLFAAQRLIRLRQHIQIILPQTDLFWTSLESLIAFLQPFQHATDVAQADNSTLYSVHQQFERLVRGLQLVPSTSFLYVLRDVVKDIILKYWHKFMPVSPIIMCSILSFHEAGQHQFNADQIHTAQEWFVAFSVDYLNQYNLSQYANVSDIRGAVRQQYADFLGNQGVFVDTSRTAADMRARQVAQSASLSSSAPTTAHYQYWNAKSVWFLYLHSAPELSTAAIALLSAAGSEAACERTFSAQSLVHSKQRNRLRDDRVEQEMFIRFNTDALESKESRARAESQQIVSLTPDCEVPRDSVLYVRSLFASLVESIEVEGKEEAVEEMVEQSMPIEPIVLMQPAQPPAITLLERFVIYYVQKHGLVAGFKWKEWQMNQLQQEAISFDPPVKDVVDDVKRHINAYLRGAASSPSGSTV